MGWQDSVDMTVWDEEPTPGPESRFTSGAGPEWHAWNEWAPEAEVADFLGLLVRLVDPAVLIETGVSQGFVTRRLWGDGLPNVETWLYEADDILRDRLPPWVHPEPEPTFDIEEAYHADLLILDSDWPQRFHELKVWFTYGKPGSYVFVHDANRFAPHGSGHRLLANVVQEMEDCDLKVMWFGNPRGSALIYKPEGWIEPFTKAPAWPKVRDQASTVSPADQGSVFVAQIDPGTVAGAFAHSMWKMLSYSMRWPGLVGGGIRRFGGPRVYASRDAVVRHFLEQTDCDWLLQIDSDMEFPHTLLEDLVSVADAESRPIVAAHCYMWRGETGPIGTMWSANPDGQTDADLVFIENYPRGGLVEVAATGAACMLIHRRVFEGIRGTPEDARYGYPFPWYEETMNGDKPVGEDLTFCIRARRAGFPIFVHTGLDVGHVKTVSMNHEYFDDWRRLRRMVVTGWPRGATGYMAQLLQKAGVMALHEGVYTPDGVDWGSRWVDSSWLAAPHLDDFDGPIVHVVRNPRHVYSSLIAIRLFDPDYNESEDLLRFRKYATEHAIWGDAFNWHEYTALFMLRWYDLIVSANPAMTVHADNVTIPEYRELLDLARTPNALNDDGLIRHREAVPKDWNRPAEGRPPELSWKDIEGMAGAGPTALLRRIAESLGYD